MYVAQLQSPQDYETNKGRTANLVISAALPTQPPALEEAPSGKTFDK